MIKRAMLAAALPALAAAAGFAVGYAQDRRCPHVDGAVYRQAEENDGRLRCIYVVEVRRQIVRGLTKEEGGK